MAKKKSNGTSNSSKAKTKKQKSMEETLWNSANKLKGTVYSPLIMTE